MDAERRAKLEASGYKIMDYAEFLELSPAEQAIIEIRLAFAQSLREQRLAQGIPQSAVAAKVRTTQKRVSLMESADKSVSLDKLIAANIDLGMPATDLLKRVTDNISTPFSDHRPKFYPVGRKPKINR